MKILKVPNGENSEGLNNKLRASLVAQAGKSLPAMQETWVQLDMVAWWATVHGVMKSQT